MGNLDPDMAFVHQEMVRSVLRWQRTLCELCKYTCTNCVHMHSMYIRTIAVHRLLINDKYEYYMHTSSVTIYMYLYSIVCCSLLCYCAH